MSAAAELKPFSFDEDHAGRDIDLQFDPLPFRPVTPYTDDLDEEYQAAQDKLRELRMQEEQIKRQAAELEELTKQEQLFKTGRTEVREELNRCLGILHREAAEARRRAEDCTAAHERLESHLNAIDALRPELWSRADRKSELARALSQIEAAEDEIGEILPLIESAGKKGGLFGGKIAPLPFVAASAAAGRGDFLYWVKCGFAFSLPLVGFAVVGLIGYFFF